MKKEMITVAFELIGEPVIYPVTVDKNGTVDDLIAACSKAVGLQPNQLNIRNFQKIMIRNSSLSFYHVEDNERIIGGKKYEAAADQVTDDNANNSQGGNASMNQNNNNAGHDADEDEDDDDCNSDSFEGMDVDVDDDGNGGDEEGQSNKKGKKKKGK